MLQKIKHADEKLKGAIFEGDVICLCVPVVIVQIMLFAVPEETYQTK